VSQLKPIRNAPSSDLLWGSMPLLSRVVLSRRANESTRLEGARQNPSNLEAIDPRKKKPIKEAVPTSTIFREGGQQLD